MVVAGPIVREDPEFFRSSRSFITLVAQSCAILASVMVVVLTLDDVVAELDTAVLAQDCAIKIPLYKTVIILI
jgi:hypothetical protein